MIKRALRSLIFGDERRATPRVSYFPAERVNSKLESPRVALGFVPLTDAAPLIVAAERGYFAAEGLAVELWRETSWASIRDKLAAGALDGAQTLAPLPLAMHLGLTPARTPMCVPLLLDRNGNAFTVSRSLYRRMQILAREDAGVRSRSGHALRAAAREALAAGRPLRFATVFPHSTHTYLLRHWLDRYQVPAQAIELSVVPPPLMVEQLAAGRIDGFIVGAPWHTLAVQSGLGRIVAASTDILPGHPEKAFAVRRSFAVSYPRTLLALTRALLRACLWLDDPEHRAAAAGLISARRYVHAPIECLRIGLEDRLLAATGETPQVCAGFHVFHRGGANCPDPREVSWYLREMMRWGEIDAALDAERLAADVFRPSLYFTALRTLNSPQSRFADVRSSEALLPRPAA